MKLRIVAYLKVTAMNCYTSYLRIVRAANSKVGEKSQSLVSPQPTHWETKWRTADIQKFLNRKLGKSDDIKVQPK